MEKENTRLEEVVCVSWEESERGWGERPDGCSLHLTRDDYQTFLKQYWDSMPGGVPDEYSRPAGEPVTAHVSRDLYKRIQESGKGLRLWQDEEVELSRRKELVYGKERSGWVPIQRK